MPLILWQKGFFLKEKNEGFYVAQNLAIGAEDIDKVDFLRNVFLFGTILMMGKEGNYPRVSARVFSCLI